MSLINSIVSWVMKQRMHQIGLFLKYPHEVQQEWMNKLVQQARDTEFGQKYDFRSIRNYDQFRERVPVHDYEGLKPYIERMMMGEQNILWPTEIRWFAKSSGTTSDKSKFIPLSQESLEECHFKGERICFRCIATISLKPGFSPEKGSHWAVRTKSTSNREIPGLAI